MQLYASAPELLEACKESFDLCDKITMPTEQDLNKLRALLRQVIEKATNIKEQ